MPVPHEKIMILNTTGSTNNYAMDMVQKGTVTHGSAVFALEQTSGKGRRHKSWASAPGANIILSVVSQMDRCFIADQFSLSMLAALSVCTLLEAHGNVQAFVKWPNDIFINDRKAAGILIENVIRGTIWQWSVTGFGVNVNQKTFRGLPNATSMSRECKRDFDVLELAVELRALFMEELQRWKDGKSDTLYTRYNERLYLRGCKVKLQAANRAFETTVRGVTKEGLLITEDTMVREWQLDEINFLL